MSESKVLERIRKLLALANSSNEHEAAAAAARAAALMAEHDLAEAEVRAAGGDAPPVAEEIVERYPLDPARGAGRRNSHWRMRCAEAVAYDLDVRCYYSQGRIMAHGRAGAVAAWQYTTTWLIGVVDRLAAQVEPPRYESARSYRAAWRLGCGDRLRDRAKEARRARLAAPTSAPTQGAALAVVERDRAELAAAYARYSARFSTTPPPSVSGSGYGAGRAAGDGIGLSRGLASGARRLGDGK